jgi:Bacterial type II and III secretion system protein
MRRIHLGSLAATLIALVAVFLTGPAHAQVVQLPTFRFFGLSTTVSVPDRGSAYLGGVSRSAMSRSERGLPIVSRVPVAGRAFGNRAIASHTESSGASVSAYIHDFEAMDEELLGRAGGLANRSSHSSQRGLGNADVVARSAGPSRRLSSAVQQSDASGRMNIAEIRRLQQQHTIAAQAAARRDFERGRELLAAGQTGVAQVYLQRAAKHADAELRAEISALAHAKSAPSSPSQVGASRPNSLATRVR